MGKLYLSNKYFLVVVVIVLVLIAALPLFLAVYETPAGYVFTGRLGQNDGDYYVYFSQMEQARQGNITFYNKFTTIDHQPVIFNPVWLALGWLSRVTGLSNPIVFHLARIILLPFLVLIIWKFIGTFYRDNRQKRLALIAVLLGGGILNYAFTTDASIFNPILFPRI